MANVLVLVLAMILESAVPVSATSKKASHILRQKQQQSLFAAHSAASASAGSTRFYDTLADGLYNEARTEGEEGDDITRDMGGANDDTSTADFDQGDADLNALSKKSQENTQLMESMKKDGVLQADVQTKLGEIISQEVTERLTSILKQQQQQQQHATTVKSPSSPSSLTTKKAANSPKLKESFSSSNKTAGAKAPASAGRLPAAAAAAAPPITANTSRKKMAQHSSHHRNEKQKKIENKVGQEEEDYSEKQEDVKSVLEALQNQKLGKYLTFVDHKVSKGTSALQKLKEEISGLKRDLADVDNRQSKAMVDLTHHVLNLESAQKRMQHEEGEARTKTKASIDALEESKHHLNDMDKEHTKAIADLNQHILNVEDAHDRMKKKLEEAHKETKISIDALKDSGKQNSEETKALIGVFQEKISALALLLSESKKKEEGLEKQVGRLSSHRARVEEEKENTQSQLKQLFTAAVAIQDQEKKIAATFQQQQQHNDEEDKKKWRKNEDDEQKTRELMRKFDQATPRSDDAIGSIPQQGNDDQQHHHTKSSISSSTAASLSSASAAAKKADREMTEFDRKLAQLQHIAASEEKDEEGHEHVQKKEKEKENTFVQSSIERAESLLQSMIESEHEQQLVQAAATAAITRTFHNNDDTRTGSLHEKALALEEEKAEPADDDILCMCADGSEQPKHDDSKKEGGVSTGEKSSPTPPPPHPTQHIVTSFDHEAAPSFKAVTSGNQARSKQKAALKEEEEEEGGEYSSVTSSSGFTVSGMKGKNADNSSNKAEVHYQNTRKSIKMGSSNNPQQQHVVYDDNHSKNRPLVISHQQGHSASGWTSPEFQKEHQKTNLGAAGGGQTHRPVYDA
eukprot:jgi/Bigna1/83641/fgenesh1_pg.112_\